MPTTPLTLDAARQKIGEIFVYHMPFNRELGLELRRFEDDYVELSFTNQPKLVGNTTQKILHGGVIASVLDVAAGLACAGSVLMRMDPLIEEEVASRLSRMGTIDLRVDYLRPGRGEHFVASASVLRSGNKVAVARVELHNHDGLHIASATATYLVG
ncbi:thioesterase family protein [Serratia sp. root2]|uniref:thioesterase family protein n=1 Tax=Serratia sp. root2 TaxID=3059676 RepID=UPI0028905A8F|nr:thioesterase family protein [Serratia sp. root2]MDT3253290.1 thioesterase family protein [Serratia sp. root2]